MGASVDLAACFASNLIKGRRTQLARLLSCVVPADEGVFYLQAHLQAGTRSTALARQ